MMVEKKNLFTFHGKIIPSLSKLFENHTFSPSSRLIKLHVPFPSKNAISIESSFKFDILFKFSLFLESSTLPPIEELVTP